MNEFEHDFDKFMIETYKDKGNDREIIDISIEGFDGVTLRTSNEAYDCLYDAPRRPCYAIRGKPITPAQAKEVILLTDSVLYKHKACNSYFYNNWCGAINNFYNDSRDSEAWGWCHFDGYIGLNHYTYDKNPFADELLYPWIELANYVDYLDMVIVITERDERVFRKSIFGEMDYHPIEDLVIGGIRVKGKVVEALSEAKARVLFMQYDRLYSRHDIKRFKYFDYSKELSKHKKELFNFRTIGDEVVGDPKEQGLVHYQEYPADWVFDPFIAHDHLKKGCFVGTKPVYFLNINSKGIKKDKYYFEASINSPAYTGYPDEAYAKRVKDFLNVIGYKEIIHNFSNAITPKNGQIIRLDKNGQVEAFRYYGGRVFTRDIKVYLLVGKTMPRVYKGKYNFAEKDKLFWFIYLDEKDSEFIKAKLAEGSTLYEYDLAKGEIQAKTLDEIEILAEDWKLKALEESR